MKRQQSDYLYIKLAGILRDQITSGVLKPSDYLMSEFQLSDYYGMSRISVRKALNVLAEEGLIVRKVGQGTMVAEHLKLENKEKRKLHICAVAPSHYIDTCMPWIAEAFEQEFPDIHIVIHRLHGHKYWEYLENLKKLGLRPDLLFVTDRLFKELGDWDDFLTLESPEGLQPFPYPKLSRLFTQKEQLKALPVTFSTVFMTYNPEMFEDHDIPRPSRNWTMEDFLDAARKLTLDTNGDGILDQYGFALRGVDTRWPLFALQHGFEFPEATNNPEPLRRTLEFLHRLLYKDRVTLLQALTSYSRLVDPFTCEKAAMTLTTAMELASWRTEDLSFEPQVCPLPFKASPSTLLLANAFMVPRDCGEPALANDFLHFIARPDIQEKLSRQFRFLSVLASVNERVFPRSFLISAAIQDRQLEQTHFLSDLFPDWQTLEELNMNLQLFWSGLESVDEVIQRFSDLCDGDDG